jgi:hypothetical protein
LSGMEISFYGTRERRVKQCRNLMWTFMYSNELFIVLCYHLRIIWQMGTQMTQAQDQMIPQTTELALRTGANPARKQRKRKWSATERWGSREGTFTLGFLLVPIKFLAHYRSLNLTTNEAVFVLQLMTFKWDAADPYPSYAAIARRMGVSEKMARRYARALEQKGLLRRKFKRRDTNRFDLSSLLDAISRAPNSANVKRPTDSRGGEPTSAGRQVYEEFP